MNLIAVPIELFLHKRASALPNIKIIIWSSSEVESEFKDSKTNQQDSVGNITVQVSFESSQNQSNAMVYNPVF